jgi:uncharacterized protein
VTNAGPFSQWLHAMRAVLRDEQTSDVPCGDCVGCCISSYPIPLRPADEVARARIPPQLLLSASGLPPGYELMGFRDDGTCPFFNECKCSIYPDRPQTCRDYDCRIFAAAGVLPLGERRIINERVLAWQFEWPLDKDRAEAQAVRWAADFIRSNSALFPMSMRTGSPIGVAVLAVKTYPIFMTCLEPAADDLIEASRLVGLMVDAASSF